MDSFKLWNNCFLFKRFLSFDFIHHVKEQVFRTVEYVIFVIHAFRVIIIPIFTHFSLRYSSFAWMHFYKFCLLFYILYHFLALFAITVSRFHSKNFICHPLLFLSFFTMSLFDDNLRTLNVFPLNFRSYRSYYISFYLWMCSRPGIFCTGV